MIAANTDEAPVLDLRDEREHEKQYRGNHPAGGRRTLGRDCTRDQQRTRCVAKQEERHRHARRMPLPHGLEARIDHCRAIEHRPREQHRCTGQCLRPRRRTRRVQRDVRAGHGNERERRQRLARQPRRAPARERAPRVARIGEMQRRCAESGDDQHQRDRRGRRECRRTTRPRLRLRATPGPRAPSAPARQARRPTAQ